MERRPLLLLFFSPWLLLLQQGVNLLQFTRDDFPDGFVFGAGTSAYQYEGAAAEDGRSPSIWDTYAHSWRNPGGETGDVACDGYHKYKEDVNIMSETGLEAYRFTISWSRLIPSGRGAVNPKGLQFYNSMINELVKAGIQIHAVLYHMDLPQSLQDEYGGWVTPKVVICVAGMTSQHMLMCASASLVTELCIGQLQCSQMSWLNLAMTMVEPYLFVDHTLLAHASVVRLYREKYKVVQKGIIGINIYSMWFYPLTNSAEDIVATERAKDFMYGWILHPLVFGDYPETMKRIAGSRLPLFSSHESELVTSAFDFIGLNHYISNYVSDNSNAVKAPLQDVTADVACLFWATKNSTPTREFLPSTSLDPKGLEHALEYLQQKYGNLLIYIQENGSVSNATLDDEGRIDGLTKYIAATLKSIRNGANVKGYSVWSFMDQYEMFGGYKAHFGLVAVDFGSGELTRQPRRSARWYSDFMKNNAVIEVEDGFVSTASHAQL